jgi:hypothetical protein
LLPVGLWGSNEIAKGHEAMVRGIMIEKVYLNCEKEINKQMTVY